MCFFVTVPPILLQNSMALAVANPLAGPDHEVAGWFHAHLTRTFVSVLRAFTEFGSGEWIGAILFFVALYFVWKKWWPSLVTLLVAVPGGMLLNEWVKVLVNKQQLAIKESGSDRMPAGKAVARPIDKGTINKWSLPVNKDLHPFVEQHSSGNRDEQGHQRRPPFFPHKVQRHEKQYGTDPLA